MYAFRENPPGSAGPPRSRSRRRRATDDASTAASTTSRTQRTPVVMLPWLRAQAINVNRHAAALRPFRHDEFGHSAAAPTEGHLRAVNALITSLRDDLLRLTQRVTGAAEAATGEPSGANLQQVVRLKERAHDRVREIERVWDFYFELFGQRQ